MSSDHNPVSCCFQMFKMKNDEDIPLTKVTFAHIENRSIDQRMEILMVLRYIQIIHYKKYLDILNKPK
ncbi:hypothetical protein PFMALIP_03186 [Plasmodium falciparum MaliPS096_E11]|nr:hypothetical protein PFMALIP_03186 [Plasmodium falciparum MaliPS096_E11]